MSLRVVDPGLHTIVVDAGRPGTRSLGVPLGGPADRLSWMLGNFLVGNSPLAAAIEFSFAGPTLDALDNVGIAISGAPFEAFVDDVPIAPNRSMNLAEGQRLRIGGARRGARGYLCVRGGIAGPSILNSRSSFEPLTRGVRIDCDGSTVPERSIQIAGFEDGPIRLRALPGAQSEWFDLDRFFGAPFIVSPASDRMGVRLRGEPLQFARRELVSEPVAPGTVQVVTDGQCIILGVDGQTIGGYPKAAHVVAADWDRVGQLRPGDEVLFEMASLEEAAAAWHERQRNLQRWAARFNIS